jgi:hypothetical protein
MKNLSRPILVATIAVVLAASASIPSDAARRVVNGQWSVVIYTLVGDCDRSLRYSVRVIDGQVQADDQSYQVSGRVTPKGEIRVMVAEGGRSASGFGRLSADSGRGQWRTSTSQCSGQWTAMRRPNAY